MGEAAEYGASLVQPHHLLLIDLQEGFDWCWAGLPRVFRPAAQQQRIGSFEGQVEIENGLLQKAEI